MDAPADTIRRVVHVGGTNLRRRVDRSLGGSPSSYNGGPGSSGAGGLVGRLRVADPIKHATICAWCWFLLLTPVFVIILEALTPEFFK
jgi:hypothetical protein